MKNTHLLLTTLTAIAAVGVFAISGCSGDDSTGATDNDSGIINNDSGPGGDGGPGTDSGPQNPAPPTLGTQIDRMGRPAVNTALNNAFNPDATSAGAAKDAYNHDQGQATWPATYSAEFAKNLAIIDSVDGTCGNQAGFKHGAGYGLAPILADDQLYVNTAGTACTEFLGVEFNALGLTNTDCGGRRPNDDVMDETYSLLALGTPAGVTDSAPSPASPATATFPYLAAAH